MALFELSKENNQTEEFIANINSFKKIYTSNKEFRNFIENPTYSGENQKIVFDKIFSIMNLNQLVKNFFLTLILKKRIFFVEQIIEEFLKLISQKRGEISGILISSKKIEDKTITEIEKAITSNIKHSIKLKTKIDESLIGGIVIQIGSLMIDTSIKDKLQKYKKLMSEA